MIKIELIYQKQTSKQTILNAVSQLWTPLKKSTRIKYKFMDQMIMKMIHGRDKAKQMESAGVAKGKKDDKWTTCDKWREIKNGKNSTFPKCCKLSENNPFLFMFLFILSLLIRIVVAVDGNGWWLEYRIEMLCCWLSLNLSYMRIYMYCSSRTCQLNILAMSIKLQADSYGTSSAAPTKHLNELCIQRAAAHIPTTCLLLQSLLSPFYLRLVAVVAVFFSVASKLHSSVCTAYNGNDHTGELAAFRFVCKQQWLTCAPFRKKDREKILKRIKAEKQNEQKK